MLEATRDGYEGRIGGGRKRREGTEEGRAGAGRGAERERTKDDRVGMGRRRRRAGIGEDGQHVRAADCEARWMDGRGNGHEEEDGWRGRGTTRLRR